MSDSRTYVPIFICRGWTYGHSKRCPPNQYKGERKRRGKDLRGTVKKLDRTGEYSGTRNDSKTQYIGTAKLKDGKLTGIGEGSTSEFVGNEMRKEW